MHSPIPAGYLEKLGFTAHSYASQGEIRGSTRVVMSFIFHHSICISVSSINSFKTDYNASTSISQFFILVFFLIFLIFQREFGDSKRVFGERRRNDSYTEEEPEWFSAGPTSQSETIELTGFDDKILEEDHKGRKRTRRRTASVKEGQ